MSTSDKLNRILQSKSDIKDAIIEKGGVVNDSTPLKDYAQAIRDIQGGKPAIVSHYQPETKARSKVIGADSRAFAYTDESILPVFTANTTEIGDTIYSVHADYEAQPAFWCLDDRLDEGDHCWWTGTIGYINNNYYLSCNKPMTFQVIRLKNEHVSPEYYDTCNIYDDISGELLGTITNNKVNAAWNELVLENPHTTLALKFEYNRYVSIQGLQLVNKIYR